MALTRRSLAWSAALSVVATLLAVSPLHSQVVNFRNYGGVDGLPQAQIMAVHQDRSGFMWFGTYGGLSRFNGKIFSTITTRDGLSSNAITAIAEDANGKLIVGTGGGGLCFSTDPGWRCISAADGLPNSSVRDLLVVGKDLWVATEGGIARIRGEKIRTYGSADGVPADRVYRLALDRKGRLWAATHAGVAIFEGNRFIADTIDAIAGASIRALVPTDGGMLLGTESGLILRTADRAISVAGAADSGDVFVTDATADPSGIVWVTTRQGVLRLENGRINRLTRGNGLVYDLVNRVLVDREHNVWFGTDNGASKLVPGPFALHAESEGLPHVFARALAQDAQGRFWVGTRNGLAVRKGDRFERVDLGKALLDPRIYSLAILRDGTMLIGTRRGLIEFRNGQARVYLEEHGLPSGFVASLLADSTGAWIGTDRGLARWEAGKIRHVTHSSLPKEMAIISMAKDERGRVWLGLRTGGVRIWDGRTASALHAGNGLTDQTIWSLSPDGSGGMWLGSNGDGAFHVSSTGIRRLDVEHGLTNDFVWQVLRQSTGAVWLYTSHGLDRWENGRIRHYARGDGLLDLEGAANTVLEDAAGDLWFGAGSGLMQYTPRLEVADVAPPPVHIERIMRDGASLDLRNARARYGKGAIQVHFASPSFRDENAIRFRYRLLGSDDGWSEPSAEPTIRYASLAPGSYVFEVVAVTDAGIMSSTPARANITILPAFWQHWLFRLGAAAIILGLIAFVPFLRTRWLEAERKRLTTLVAQHTQTLEDRNARLEREIAEREAAQQAHARIEEQLRHGQKLEAIGRLAGGIAHDFNNLLTSVVGHSELLADELGPRHPSIADLGEIRRAADRGASLVSQLLAFSRQQPMKRSVLDLNAIVTDSARMLQRMLGTDVTLHLNLQSDLGRIRADQSQVDQILVNLALNARDAMPHGGTLSITTSNVDLVEPITEDVSGESLSGECVLVRVADSGHGMDEVVRSRVFEPFFTTKGVGKGTGLGLSTVYGIVKQNDGQIFVESAPNSGTAFLIYLPRLVAQAPADPIATLPSSPDDGDCGHEVVLVVEDEDSVRALVSRTLKRCGYRVLEAPDGARAIEVAQQHAGPIHLLLSDMIMPGMSGKDVADAITSSRPDIRVLFMSGHTRDVLGSRGMLQRHTDLIQKPFGAAKLVGRVRDSLDGVSRRTPSSAPVYAA